MMERARCSATLTTGRMTVDEVWTAARGPTRISDPKTIHMLVT